MPNISEFQDVKLQAEAKLFDAQRYVEELKATHIKRELDQYNAKAEENRVFTIYGPINYDTVAHCMYEMDSWSRRYPGEDMTLVLNSPGGSLSDGFALVDFLRELQGRGHSLTIKAFGWAASMGGIILQVADRRVLGKNSFIMLHELQAGMAEQRLAEIEDATKLIRRFQDKALDILSARSVWTKRQIKTKWQRKDCWLDADEALKAGFIDEIL